MIRISHILCPVDFSDFSRRALDYAIGVARWYGARVTALHVASAAAPLAGVAPEPAAMAPLGISAVDLAVLRARLEDFIDAESASGVLIHPLVTEGKTWQEISEQAGALRADLMVLGTHGRSGFERLLLGSVTERLLRVSTCPVLTVPRAAADAVPVAPGLFKRILCPTDFSPSSQKAMTWALAIAQESDAELFVLHVFELTASTEYEGFPRSTLAAYRDEYEGWCSERLRDAVPQSARTWCTVHELRATGAAHREILHAAERHHCDLIVMGVGGGRGLGDRVFGSTTQHVVRAAACPVLTTRLA